MSPEPFPSRVDLLLTDARRRAIAASLRLIEEDGWQLEIPPAAEQAPAGRERPTAPILLCEASTIAQAASIPALRLSLDQVAPGEADASWQGGEDAAGLARWIQVVTPLAWDSRFFGRRAARLHHRRLTERVLGHALDACAAGGTEVLYFLCDSGDPPSVRLAERAGFRLVDVRLTLGRSLEHPEGPEAPAPAGSDPILRPGTPADGPRLDDITRGAYRRSRFYSDGNFPHERCDELYVGWLRGYLEGGRGEVRVAEKAGHVLGYIAIDPPVSGCGRISLIAVDPRARGSGTGGALVRDACRRVVELGGMAIEVVTHGGDPRAVRLYERAGFLLRQTELWFHGWFR